MTTGSLILFSFQIFLLLRYIEPYMKNVQSNNSKDLEHIVFLLMVNF